MNIAKYHPEWTFYPYELFNILTFCTYIVLNLPLCYPIDYSMYSQIVPMYSWLEMAIAMMKPTMKAATLMEVTVV